MRHDLSWVPASLLSDDVTQMREAAHIILSCWQKEQLQGVAAEILPNLAGRKDMDFGGGIIPNRHWFDTAVAKLEISNSKRCLCDILKESEFFDPQKVQEQGQTTILQQSHDAKTWSSKYRCSCNACGRTFDVSGEAGWHVPWWKWR